jgi:hypothetical protein
LLNNGRVLDASTRRSIWRRFTWCTPPARVVLITGIAIVSSGAAVIANVLVIITITICICIGMSFRVCKSNQHFLSNLVLRMPCGMQYSRSTARRRL